MGRKGFNFYRSYYEVAKQLSDKDRLEFLWAVIQKQFEGIDPTLKSSQANFAYISQKHSIDTQVAGYENKTRQKLTPCLPPTEPPCQPPSVQEEEKEEEKEQYVSKKISFVKSEIFDKNKFKEKFSDWPKDKLSYYYDSALRYSNEGNKYKDWVATVRSWARKDELQGKIKFNTQPPTNKLTFIV